MAGHKRPRTADHDPPPPTLPPQSRAKSSGVRTSTRQAKSPGVLTSTQQAMSSRPTRSTSARGKTSIVPTPTETPSLTTSEHHGDGPQDASDAGNSHGTLKGRELVRETLKIVNNADSAELMILELMGVYVNTFAEITDRVPRQDREFSFTARSCKICSCSFPS
jgi:hypothetical protein